VAHADYERTLVTSQPGYEITWLRVIILCILYTLRVNILTCHAFVQLKLEDSAEFQIVPTISNQISIIVQNKSVVLKLSRSITLVRIRCRPIIEFFNQVELQICK
jgi:hypothetical protein